MDDMQYYGTAERRLFMRARETNTPINGSLELLPLCNMNCDMCYVRLSKQEMEKQGRMRTGEEERVSTPVKTPSGSAKP